MAAYLRLILMTSLFVAGCLTGYFYCKGNSAQIIESQLKEDAQKVEEIKEKEVIRYVEVEKIKEVIKTIPDTSGCLDTPLGDAIADQLHQAYSTD